jgi:predicted aconitase with swiveling domain
MAKSGEMTSSGVEARALIEGRAAGEVVVLDEPLSFWGGVDPATGRVVDRRHPQVGARLAGRIVVMPSGRGSSSSSSVLAEAIRAGTAPAGIVLARPDPIIVLGALVARELYESSVPVVVVDDQAYALIETGMHARIDGSRVHFMPPR